MAHHRAGRLAEAGALYGQVLQAEPDNCDALHLRGVTALQAGDYASAVTLIERAIGFRADPAYHANLGHALNCLGRYEAAAAACRTAAALDPNSALAQCNLGNALRGLGRLDDAAGAYRAALDIAPEFADAHSNLGVVLVEQAKPAEAVEALRAALALRPSYPEALYNLGNALAELDGRWEEAVEAYRQATALNPLYVEAHANLGTALKRLGRPEEAAAAYSEAARLRPGWATPRYNLGLVLEELKRTEEALAAHQAAVACDPDHGLAWSHLANALLVLERTEESAAAHERAVTLLPDSWEVRHNLGAALFDRRRFEEALAAHEQALKLKPDFAEAQAGRANALRELNRLEEAVEAAQAAIALKPDYAIAWCALGNIRVEQGLLEEGEAAYGEAASRDPTLADGRCNLGVARFRQGRLDEAEADYRAALEMKPDWPEAHWNLGLLLLQRGDYARGWEEYDWRLKTPSRRASEGRFTTPLWRGEDIAGKRLLLYSEQGLGDMIQCARFIAPAAARAGEVILMAPGALKPLLGRAMGVTRFVAETSIPEHDVRLSLFSLPRVLGATPESLPATAPYLTASPRLSERWAKRLETAAPGPGLRVGIVWSGNVTAKVDRGRSIPLACFAPLARVPGVTLISLQKEFGLDQLTTLPEGMTVATLGADYDAGTFADTAAVIANLDLLVACDTSVAHLAGALGRPAWMAINAVGDWRWMTGREDTPWYPSMRLFRQPRRGDWDAVFEWMAGALAEGGKSLR